MRGIIGYDRVFWIFFRFLFLLGSNKSALWAGIVCIFPLDSQLRVVYFGKKLFYVFAEVINNSRAPFLSTLWLEIMAWNVKSFHNHPFSHAVDNFVIKRLGSVLSFSASLIRCTLKVTRRPLLLVYDICIIRRDLTHAVCLNATASPFYHLTLLVLQRY